MLKKIVIPLLQWYNINKRVLPWRDKNNAYYTWVSEIMLQQTRVEAVKPYFQRFITALPDVQALAQCPQEQLLKLWEGLGYYNRVRNMQEAARQVVSDHQGIIPEDYQTLLSLKGIGSYTAGAIASIAYHKSVPAVDGNVLRVITRITENNGDISRQSVRRVIEEELSEIMPEDKPGDFNQALMELGAVVCIPNGMAKCEECPVASLCQAYCHSGRRSNSASKATAQGASGRPVRVAQCPWTYGQGAGSGVCEKTGTGSSLYRRNAFFQTYFFPH